ncbi:MAG: ribosome maturation factor RimM [Pseudohongiellaceae bacterium]
MSDSGDAVEPKLETEQLGNSDSPRSVVLGKLGKAHGIKGWLRVISFTSPAENLLEYHSFDAHRNGKHEKVEIDGYKQQAGGFIAHVKGVDTPEAARLLTGYELNVLVSELPVLEQDDIYWYQLEGLKVENQHQQNLGSVARLLETGANDVIVVQATASSIDGRERLIPFIRESIISKIDLPNGIIEVNWEADYLE